MKRSIYLNESENLTLELVAEGTRYRDIRERVNFPDGPSHRFHPFLADLRRKTGISDLQNRAEIEAYRAKIDALDLDLPLSDRQNQHITDTIDQVPASARALRLGITPAEMATERAETLNSIGILTSDECAKRMQARVFIATRAQFGPKKMPLSSTHWKILHAIARGEVLSDILDLPEKNIRALTKDACERAGIVCPGRNARRNLIRLFIAAHEEREREQAAPTFKEQKPENSHYDLFFWTHLGITLEALARQLGKSFPDAIANGLKTCKRLGFDTSSKAILGRDWIDPASVVRSGEKKLTPEEIRLLRHYACKYSTPLQASRNAGIPDMLSFLLQVESILSKLEVREKTRDEQRPILAAILRRVTRPEATEPEITMDDPAF